MGKKADEKRNKNRKTATSATDEVAAVRLPHSTPGHVERIDQAVLIALALPASFVTRPDLPVEDLLRDARAVAGAATAHLEVLVARGLGEALPGDLIARADALSQAQAMWLAERSRGLKATASALVLREAERVRADAIAVLGLALRRSRDGLARLDTLGHGEGTADLIADLAALASLARDADLALADINDDADGFAASLDKSRRTIEQAIDGDAARVVSTSKDLRDRLAILVEDAIDEIRAFAAVAFRGDATWDRRGAFSPVGLRRRPR